MLIPQFIRAERTADWNLHIETVKRKRPNFHSSGHLHYANCAHLYLTLMKGLLHKMSSEDFQRFTKDGYFTTRRSGRFWSGVSTDIYIEQVVMRGFKAIGGLTHSRGITDSALQRWVLSAPVCVEISKTLSEFAGVSITDGQKNIVVNISSIKRFKRLCDIRHLVNYQDSW